MFDACWFSAYRAGRAWRKIVDVREQQEKNRLRKQQRRRIKQEQHANKRAKREQEKLNKKAKREMNGVAPGAGVLFRSCEMFFFNFGLEEKTCAADFPNYSPLPFLGAKLITSALIITMTLLLHSGSQNLPSGGGYEFCAVDDFERQMAEMRSQLRNETNFKATLSHSDFTHKYFTALQTDTALYGKSGHICTNVDMKQNTPTDWTDSEKLKYGTYFPGACAAAREKALEAAKNRVCYGPPNCVCVARFIFCIKEVCTPVPVKCPDHTLDYDEQDLTDYRTVQLEIAAARTERQAAERFRNATESEEAQQAKDTVVTLFLELMRRVDIAGNLYIFYVCLALFFPTPVVLLRTPMLMHLKKIMFGMDKWKFVVLVVFVWVSAEYISTNILRPEVQIFLRNFQANPCYVDQTFLDARREELQSVCEELTPAKAQWQIDSVSIADTLTEIGLFKSSCQCEYPSTHLRTLFANFTAQHTATATGIHTITCTHVMIHTHIRMLILIHRTNKHALSPPPPLLLPSSSPPPH
jgi:hypothetical protein